MLIRKCDLIYLKYKKYLSKSEEGNGEKGRDHSHGVFNNHGIWTSLVLVAVPIVSIFFQASSCVNDATSRCWDCGSVAKSTVGSASIIEGYSSTISNLNGSWWAAASRCCAVFVSTAGGWYGWCVLNTSPIVGKVGADYVAWGWSSELWANTESSNSGVLRCITWSNCLIELCAALRTWGIDWGSLDTAECISSVGGTTDQVVDWSWLCLRSSNEEAGNEGSNSNVHLWRF